MKTILVLVIACLLSRICQSQNDTLENDYASRIHFSGMKGQWSVSGEELYDKDSLLTYSSIYGYKLSDENVSFIERTWYFPNGKKERFIYVNFKKRKRAQIIDSYYTKEGKLKTRTKKKARRIPEQNTVDKVIWEK